MTPAVMTVPCRGCKAQIMFATTVTGKTIPVDPHPSVAGNLRLTEVGTTLHAEVVEPMSEPTLFLSHFATCPVAPQFRKPKAARS